MADLQSLKFKFDTLQHELTQLEIVRKECERRLYKTQDEYMENYLMSARDMQRLYNKREKALRKCETEISRKQRKLESLRRKLNIGVA